MRRQFHLLFVWLVLLALVALIAPAMAETAAHTVTVRLTNYRILPSVTSIVAGPVTFVVHNTDNVPHNFVVLRTNIASASLPVTGRHGRAQEVGRVGGTPVFYTEQTERLTVNLSSGRYLLICNVPGHFQRGMVAVVRVSQ